MKHLEELGLNYLKQVDNTILEMAVNKVESDETRMFIACNKTRVDADSFREQYKGTTLESDGVYTYKSLSFSVFV